MQGSTNVTPCVHFVTTRTNYSVLRFQALPYSLVYSQLEVADGFGYEGSQALICSWRSVVHVAPRVSLLPLQLLSFPLHVDDSF